VKEKVEEHVYFIKEAIGGFQFSNKWNAKNLESRLEIDNFNQGLKSIITNGFSGFEIRVLKWCSGLEPRLV
jgi:hypothetical protein